MGGTEQFDQNLILIQVGCVEVINKACVVSEHNES